jgi:hypothetical protein
MFGERGGGLRRWACRPYGTGAVMGHPAYGVYAEYLVSNLRSLNSFRWRSCGAGLRQPNWRLERRGRRWRRKRRQGEKRRKRQGPPCPIHHERFCTALPPIHRTRSGAAPATSTTQPCTCWLFARHLILARAAQAADAEAVRAVELLKQDQVLMARARARWKGSHAPTTFPHTQNLAFNKTNQFLNPTYSVTPLMHDVACYFCYKRNWKSAQSLNLNTNDREPICFAAEHKKCVLPPPSILGYSRVGPRR